MIKASPVIIVAGDWLIMEPNPVSAVEPGENEVTPISEMGKV